MIVETQINELLFLVFFKGIVVDSDLPVHELFKVFFFFIVSGIRSQ